MIKTAQPAGVRLVDPPINLGADRCYVDRVSTTRQAGQVRFQNEQPADYRESRLRTALGSEMVHNSNVYNDGFLVNPTPVSYTHLTLPTNREV